MLISFTQKVLKSTYKSTLVRRAKKRKNKNSRDNTTKIAPEHENTQVSPTDGLKRNISDRSLSRDEPVKDDNQLPDKGGNMIAQRKKQKFKLVINPTICNVFTHTLLVDW